MNLIDAFNIISNSARSVKADGASHEKIKEALKMIAPVIQKEYESEKSQKEGIEE